jgi:hypothetical protein
MWAMSFCMSIHSTDDEAHPDVMSCYLVELDALAESGIEEDCSLNLAYKSAICRAPVESGRFEGGLIACVNSDETVPRIVATGGI